MTFLKSDSFNYQNNDFRSYSNLTCFRSYSNFIFDLIPTSEIFSILFQHKRFSILFHLHFRSYSVYPSQGVAVDNKTGSIYIADQSNNCVKVFDSTAKYLFKFGDNNGEGKMDIPLSVAICGDRILISQGNDCILN